MGGLAKLSTSQKSMSLGLGLNHGLWIHLAFPEPNNLFTPNRMFLQYRRMPGMFGKRQANSSFYPFIVCCYLEFPKQYCNYQIAGVAPDSHLQFSPQASYPHLSFCLMHCHEWLDAARQVNSLDFWFKLLTSLDSHLTRGIAIYCFGKYLYYLLLL